MLHFAGGYHPFDTYDAWRGKRASQQRLLIAIAILNVLPFLNFAWILITLGRIFISLEWDLTNISVILLVLILSLTVHGYYRIFVALLYKFPRSFYKNQKRIEYFTKLDEEGKTASFGARFWPGLLYIVIPNFLLLLASSYSTRVSPQLNQTQISGAVSVSPISWIVSGANYYSNLLVAVFTGAAVLIAFFQVKHEIGGPNITLHFPTSDIPLIGPSALTDPLYHTDSMAIFFDARIVFVNDGPQAGVVASLKLELLDPDPKHPMQRPTGEQDAFVFQYYFDAQNAVNEPVGALTVEGNSAIGIHATCAILKTNLDPGDSSPPTPELENGSLSLEVGYVVINRKGELTEKVGHTYRIVPAVYDENLVKSYMKKLRM